MITSAQSIALPALKFITLNLDQTLQGKYQQLQQIFTEISARGEKVLVAYSGGIDSTLVAKLAHDALGAQALAVTANSPSLLPADLDAAIEQAAWIGITHQVVTTHELDNPNYAANPVNRCYFCKSELHDTLKPLAQELGYDMIWDGLNADDLSDYRPGIQAAKERGVRSPLAEVGMSKLEVRMLSQALGLPWWDKPAQPCLSSRFPYGETITIEKLRRVGQAEQFIRQAGWRGDLRVRSSEDTAKIEVPASKIAEFIAMIAPEVIAQALRGYGFTAVVLDLEGFRSGKLNDVLPQKLTKS
ncbi:MAG: ATP-dependent sacrificial sulfur transferase LarE [Pseudanabaena sp. ELA607]